MKVSERDKKTELGLIPEDWNFVEFHEVMDGFSSGQTPYRGRPEFYTGNIPWITSGELNYNVITDTKEKITIEGVQDALLKTIPVGTFLFAITGLEAAGTRGSCAITGIEATTNQSCMALYPKKGLLTTPYLYHFYVRYGNDLAFKYCQGTKQQSFTGGIAKKLPIIIPPTLEEQTAIATALSDADALISSLEKLIAKKRNIKQGAVQKLLQPKEAWETKTLKELAKYRRGSFPQPYGLDKWYDDTNGYPFVQVYDVDDNFRLKNETKRRISKEAQEMSVFIEKGSVIITLQGSIGRIAITQYDAYVDRTLLFFESFIVPFDKFFFMISIFRLFELEKEKAPGGIIKTITKEALSSFKISYPKIEEQTEIATLLSDMDAEISALESKLEKYKKVKLGMMQNLLTGKIRLI
jgi:type I restriction enzyme S subunit